MIPINLHREVYKEIEGSRRWYEEQAEGLGDQFLEEVDRAMSHIRQSPEVWPAYISGTKRFFLRRFPFALIYTYEKETIKVFALAHHHRRPGYWRKRYN